VLLCNVSEGFFAVADTSVLLCNVSEGFLASVTKTLQKHVPVGATSRDAHDNLEHSMKRVCVDCFLNVSIYLLMFLNYKVTVTHIHHFVIV